MKSIQQLAYENQTGFIGKLLSYIVRWVNYHSADVSRWRPFKTGTLLFCYHKWAGQWLPSLTIFWGKNCMIDIGSIFYDGWGFRIHLQPVILFHWHPFGVLEHWLEGNMRLEFCGYKIVTPVTKTYAHKSVRVVARIDAHKNCYDINNARFFSDDVMDYGIKKGDTITQDIDDNSFTRQLWINGKKVADNYSEEYHAKWRELNMPKHAGK